MMSAEQKFSSFKDDKQKQPKPYHHKVTFIPIEYPSLPPSRKIKSIIRQSSSGDFASLNSHPGRAVSSRDDQKCVRFVPIPNILVYERTNRYKDDTENKEPQEFWLASPTRRRFTLTPEKQLDISRSRRKRCRLLHPSNILFLIVFLAIITIILVHKKKKKIPSPVEILLAFVG